MGLSLLALGSTLLRSRRPIGVLALSAASLALVVWLLTPSTYVATATFIPQGVEPGGSSVSGIAVALGVRVPDAEGLWGTPVYAELLRSRSLLGRLALDTMVVAEEGHRRVPIMDLLEIEAATPEWRLERAVRRLQRLVAASEDKKLNAVQVQVATEWPSVSLAVVQNLLRGINDFNIETRKSQATAERKFAEEQAVEAERALREAEIRHQDFLMRNRAMSTAVLTFENDRLQREVALRQQLYTSLLQNREEARIREVRETPVITVLDGPVLPVRPESRGWLKVLLVGGVTGLGVGVLIALLAGELASATRAQSAEALEFRRLLREATPRALRRRSP
jgi:uncharacterized protein involved in exopolysaccharide biosynthesis